MKYFKVEAKRTAQRFEISSKIFEKETGRKYPFEQINKSKTISDYAICPSCLNPIQLIGLDISNKNPYGRHTGKPIKGLPDWKYNKYRFCPYADKSIHQPPTDEYDNLEIDDGIIELYNLLRSQFDRVVYLISNELEIRCNKKFWKETLNQFLVNRVYCYPWLTEANLPYIFAYRGMQHSNVWGQKIKVGSELYSALERYPNVCFDMSDGAYQKVCNKNNFLDLHFRFTQHKQNAPDGRKLVETMLFCVDDFSNNNTLFEKEITFSETYFINLINKSDNNDKRQQWLLDVANELMPDLIRIGRNTN